ncbi:MAG TPA: pyridoxamine 5'-phosphate oxidase family protein, partial [Phototrophicaceae bacterium]|nr:pyridoxamine 5'-phosphate oxidase family protein [Phototrophicaceae bacterium]
MAKVFECITDDFREWIAAQHLFFVASAPLSADGHINVSPKGQDCLRVLSDHQVAYLDLTGSGNETSAHLEENGRITLMFCAFEGPPRILRLYGTGRTVLLGTPEWDELIDLFTPMPGMRQIIVIDVTRVQTSCGYAVPFFNY